MCVCVLCTVLSPAGLPVWPVSADSPDGPWHPLLSSDYRQSWRDLNPVTSPSLFCKIKKKKGDNLLHQKISVFPKQSCLIIEGLMCFSHLSAKALISHSSRSSSGTHVSTAIGPVSLAGSCFLGLKALERRPFLCGVGVSIHRKTETNCSLSVLTRKKKLFQQWISVNPLFYK